MTRPSEKRFDLVESFDALALAGKKPDPDKTLLHLVDNLDNLALHNEKPDAKKLPILRPGNPFGGFARKILAFPPGRAPPPASNRNAAQQSLTMQYALKLPIPIVPERHAVAPPLDTTPPPPISDSIVSPKVAKVPLTPPHRAVNALTQPTLSATPHRPRTVSAPFSPTTSSPGRGTVQCSGITLANKRCSRPVKLRAMHSLLDPIPDLYCYQHKDALMSQSGFYLQKAGNPEKFVDFRHYIPKYLQMDTQLALRAEIGKETSAADKPGFIYAFEIRDPKKTGVIQLKVGRAVNLNKRFNEWDKQCRSKEQIPRGWWPGTVEDDGGSLLKGNIKAGDPGPFCHRVERLVHIELADLSSHAPYLDPEWPDIVSGSTPVNSPRKSAAKENKCPDCGAAHKEIFDFRRPDEGQYVGKEWEMIVKPVIEKWGKFVKDYYA